MEFDPNILLKQYIDYIEKVLCLAPKTVDNRRSLANLLKRLQTTDIRELTIEQIDEYFALRSQEVSIPSYNTDRRHLRGFLHYVQRYRKVPMKFDYSMIREVRCPQKKVRPFTAQEIKRVIEQTENEQDKLMIATLFEAGLRISELVSLNVEDVSGTRLQIRGKGGKVRLTFVTPYLAERLTAHIVKNQTYTGPIFRHLQPHRNLPTQHYAADTVRTRMKKAFRKAGFSMFPHQVRHSYATQLLTNGADIRSVQTLLGHANINTTMRYLHVSDNHLEESFRRSFATSVA